MNLRTTYFKLSIYFKSSRRIIYLGTLSASHKKKPLTCHVQLKIKATLKLKISI